MQEVAEGVYGLGSKWINFYVVEDAGALTLVDTGVPGYLGQVEPGLAKLGKGPRDVKAIVLTHTHSDHIGCAPDLARSTGAPVLVPTGEHAIATGGAKPIPPKGFLSSLWRPTMLAFAGHVVANRGLKPVTVREATAYDGGDVLDVPGKPRVVHTPGHSSAHCALVLEDRGVLLCGDALATLAVNTGETGPMVHPFNQDRAGAVRSLDALESVDAGVLLPGHGEPWRGNVTDAVAGARRRA